MIAFTIRASSFGDFLDCAYRWEARHLLGMSSPSSGAARLGTAIHASTAAFDQGKIDGSKLTATDTAGVLVDTLRDQQEPVDWRNEDMTIGDAERIGLTLHTRYCLDVSPRYDFTAVEMETSPLSIEVEAGTIITLTGKMDRARVKRGMKGAGIADLKSGKRAVGKDGRASVSGHAAQVGVYELLYEHNTGERITEPAEIIGLKTSQQPVVGVGVIHGAKSRLIGRDGDPGLLEMAARMMKAGLFPPNPRSALCSERYCVRFHSCKFHD